MDENTKNLRTLLSEWRCFTTLCQLDMSLLPTDVLTTMRLKSNRSDRYLFD